MLPRRLAGDEGQGLCRIPAVYVRVTVPAWIVIAAGLLAFIDRCTCGQPERRITGNDQTD
jgi:hypothetical protein